MSDSPGQRELFELFEGLYHGRLQPPEHERLQRYLQNNAEAQRLYLQYIDMQMALRRLRRQDLSRNEQEVASPRGGRPAVAQRFAGHSVRAAALAVVATLFVAVIFALVLRNRQQEFRGGSIAAARRDQQAALGAGRGGDRRDSASATGLAVIIKLDGVRWESADGVPPAEGDVLTAQRFRLSGGRATLAFLNGVMLTLEGPADLELSSIDRVFCRRGKLHVRVPAGAEGFVVAAPGSSIVDLGTEFALNVEVDGKARVMVFEGEAEAAVLGAAGTSERSQLVEESKAFEIDPQTGKIKEEVANRDSFITPPDLAAPILALDPAYTDAVLQSRPWGYWRFGSMAQGAAPNEIPAGPPLRVTGPVSLADAAGNGCALFDASDAAKYLELDGLWEPPRDPGYAVELWVMPEQYNYSTLVALLAPMNNQKYGHFSLLELMACGRYPFPRSASVRFLNRWPPGGQGGVSVHNGVPYQLYRWHHLVAQSNGDRMELYMDGVLTRSEPLDPDRSTAPCRMVLGRLLTFNRKAPETYRPFIGRLDEVALYDHPLSAEEVGSHYQLATQQARGK